MAMRTFQKLARVQSTPMAHDRQLPASGHLRLTRSSGPHGSYRRQGCTKAANVNDSGAAALPPPPPAAPAPAAAAADPGLEAFKALIGNRRFTCTQCGKCCTGAGEVWVSTAEAASIARYLDLSLPRFLALHCHAHSQVEGFKLLRSNMDSETRDCTFLRPDNTCAIHPVRPLQCSTYPWWPELMNDKEWQLEKESICEGFDHPEAPSTDVHAAAQQLKLATIQEYQKRLAYKPSRKQSNKAAAAAKLQPVSSSTSSSSSSSSQMNEAHDAGQAMAGPSSSGSNSSRAASWQEKLRGLQDILDQEQAQQ